MSDAGVRAVWTDFGGVCTEPVAETMKVFSARVGVAVPALQAAMLTVAREHRVTDPLAPLDTPLIGELDWARAVERVLARDFDLHVRLGDPGEAWFADRPANTAWIGFLRRLRASGLFVGMLSNMVPTWERHWRAMVAHQLTFDATVMSYQVGFRKPAHQIFTHAAAVAGVPAHACVLIDDLPANCAGAQAAGWSAIHFTDTGTAVEHLTALIDKSGVAAAAGDWSTP
ncbi:HAD-IA family hydrolase [Actinoplanes sp. N902-109]|uniref:HAD-IA family hydrolase n=1 Tax=Actinoplanes sp. (strain N902-109) TaxID=649831 RepID=UPI0003295558|nr:HAD-IA family hydrolase [Actinoplanes sp. N902-109]AGL13742.1 HAD family hydrolase [Actinoplanes sp. N902-109]